MFCGPGGMMDGDGGQLTKIDELDYELWHACAGPLTALPPLDSLVMYWPQGHIEQVVACTPGSACAADVRAASKHYYLPPHLLCKISRMELQADLQTDEVFAQMDLTPQQEGSVTKEMREEPPSSRQKNVRMFCKTLTASDTSTHGGFSVPRRSAEECLPLLDHSMNPPCQELVAKDLHGVEWNFRHIYRGQPRRHLLTTGWSTFVSAKKLVAGDTVIFLRGENGQLRVGVRRASKQQTHTKSTCFSSANLHLGVLAAATHAAQNSLRFSVIFNPRTSPSEFVIPYHKFLKSQENNLTAGCRFKMRFESEESSERKYAGTIVEVSHADPVEWPESSWRSIRVQWDEMSASERPERVSPWEIEPFVPISTLPPPQVGLRPPKRRPSTLVKESAPQGSIQSMLDSYEPNKMPRMEPSVEDDEECEVESSRASPWVTFKQELSPRIPGPPQCWLPRPDMPSHMLISDPFQLSPQSSSVASFAAPLPPGGSDMDRSVKFGNLEPSPGNARPHPPWPTARRSDFPAGVNFPFREPPPCPPPSPQLPSWLCSPKPGGVSSAGSIASASRPAFERPMNVPITSLNNEAATEISLPAQKQISFESVWDKVGPAKKVETTTTTTTTAAVPDQQCKLFGINLAEKAALGALNLSAPSSHSSDSDGSDPWPSTDDPSAISVDQHHVSKFAAGSSSQAPVRTGTKVYMPGQFGRTIDLKKIDSYEGLYRTLALLFKLQGQLDDSSKGWKLVYKDHENDVLLVGDDPWEEFRSCVKSLKIVNPADAAEKCWGKYPASSSEDEEWYSGTETQRGV